MVEWVAELPRNERARRGKYDWAAAAEALKSRPGEWAVVARDAPRSHRDAILSGKKVAFRPPEDYEVVTRGSGRRADIVMRFIGAPGARLKGGEAP